MKRIFGVLLLASLSACSSSIEKAGQDEISIKFNGYADSSTTLQPLADAECAKSGRKAAYSETTMDEGVFSFLTHTPQYAHYRCVKPG